MRAIPNRPAARRIGKPAANRQKTSREDRLSRNESGNYNAIYYAFGADKAEPRPLLGV